MQSRKICLLAKSSREQHYSFNYLQMMWLWGLRGRAEGLRGFPFPLPTPSPVPRLPLFSSKIALIKNAPECPQAKLVYCSSYFLSCVGFKISSAQLLPLR